MEENLKFREQKGISAFSTNFDLLKTLIRKNVSKYFLLIKYVNLASRIVLQIVKNNLNFGPKNSTGSFRVN